MKIFQICTLITPDAAYGGPVRVAVNQTRALLDAGHEVTLLAGARGFGPSLPSEYDGVPVKLFPAKQMVPRTGFAGLASPALARYLLDQPRPDVVHVHMARDLVTLPAAAWARFRKVPYVLQTHGMIDRSNNPLSAPLDAWLTRSALSGAASVFYLTDVERSGLEEVARKAIHLKKLENGVPLASTEPRPAKHLEVLYLARLHSRKRPLNFVSMAIALSPNHPNATFRLVGPDEGEGQACAAAIRLAGLGAALSMEGSIAPDLALRRLEAASVYVLPSVNEPFPMSVLEAMSLGKPVVVTDTCGLASAIDESGAGLVVDDSQESLDDAVDRLLSNDHLRAAMGQNAYRLAQNRYGMKPVLETLVSSYGLALSTFRP